MSAPTSSRGRIVLVLILMGAIIGALVLGLVTMSAMRPKPQQAEQVVRGLAVFVEQAEPATVRLSVKTQGEVRPRREIDLIPQVAGKVTYLAENFVAGGFFNEGDVLLRIEDADYRLAVTRASAEVARAQRALDREQAEAEIARRDWEELGEGEASALTLREPQLAEARAALAAARAQLQDAQLQLGRTELTAPFTGRVREKAVDVGQYVTPGQRLGRVFSTDVVEVRVPLTDAELALLDLPVAFQASDGESGPVVRISGDLAGRRHEWAGHIARTDSAIDTQSRTLFAFVEVEDPYGAGSDDGAPLAVGLFIDAEIEGREVDGAVTLPRSALRGHDEVYVAKLDGTLDIRTAAVVTSDREKVVFSSGLEPGEYVVTSPILTPSQGLAIEAYSRDGQLLFPEREDEDGDQDGEEDSDAAEDDGDAVAANEDGDRS